MGLRLKSGKKNQSNKITKSISISSRSYYDVSH